MFKDNLRVFGKKGKRNIAFAKKIIDRKIPSIKSLKIIQNLKTIEDDRTLTEMTFLGTIALDDPIKDGI